MTENRNLISGYRNRVCEVSAAGPGVVRIYFTIIILSLAILLLALLSLLYGDDLARNINVIGIRIATLLVAFAAFCSTTAFSYLIYEHNRTVLRANDDANRRNELFRELQFVSANYSIIELMDRMLIYTESSRYIGRFIRNRSMMFHMLLEGLEEEHIYSNPEAYDFISLKTPFRVAEGKMVGGISIETVRFERNEQVFRFLHAPSDKVTQAFLLYNDKTKRRNMIFNVVVPKSSDFFHPDKVNLFSKIKLKLKLTSILGVCSYGVSELFFTNPTQNEGDGTNSYEINSSYFKVTRLPELSVE